MEKSHVISDDIYWDVTTGKHYKVKPCCELCKTKYPLSVHHYLNQQKCLRDTSGKKVKFPKMWTQEFIDENQKLFTLCFQCHSDVENMNPSKFFEKYGRKKSDFVYEVKNGY